MLSLILTFLPWKPSKVGWIARDSSLGKAVNLHEIFINQSRWECLKENVIHMEKQTSHPRKYQMPLKQVHVFHSIKYPGIHFKQDLSLSTAECFVLSSCVTENLSKLFLTNSFVAMFISWLFGQLEVHSSRFQTGQRALGC